MRYSYYKMIKKTEKKGIYQIESKSTKGKFYDINILNRTCTCPGFMFRKACRHIKEVTDHVYAQKDNIEEKREVDDIITYVKNKLEVDSIDLIEKFGEDKINHLIDKGDLIEEKGKIRILE